MALFIEGYSNLVGARSWIATGGGALLVTIQPDGQPNRFTAKVNPCDGQPIDVVPQLLGPLAADPELPQFDWRHVCYACRVLTTYETTRQIGAE